MNAFGGRIERFLALAALVAVPLIAPLRNVQLAASWGALFLLCCGVLICWFLFSRALGPLGTWLVKASERVRLRNVLVAGVVAQILIAAATSPIPVSDFEHYSYIARQIASQSIYRDEYGRRALWPPGWPIAYVPFVWFFGATLAATTVANVLLYLAAAYATWSLADRLSGERAAVVATLLFTFWPARLLMAGLAAKENLLIALIVAGMSLAFKALDPSARRPLATALCAGFAFGAAALTQPGVAILIVAAPLAYRFAIAEVGARRFAAFVAAVLAGAAIAVAPWMARNCIVFEGAFCGISTNGGGVFYRANNANAMGVYASIRGTPLANLSEVEQNRRGYELGRQWIAEHPLDATKLALRKVFAYLGGDDYGAYWSVLRGSGGNEEEAVTAASAQRIVIYRLAKFVSIAYWVLLAAMCAQALWRWTPTDSRACRVPLPLFYPLLCGAAVFGIFESGDRQHMFAVGPLIVLAAGGVVQRESTLRASTGGTRL